MANLHGLGAIICNTTYEYISPFIHTMYMFWHEKNLHLLSYMVSICCPFFCTTKVI